MSSSIDGLSPEQVDFLSSIDAAGAADRVALVNALCDALDAANGARPVVALVRSSLVALRDVIGMPGVVVDADADALAAAIDRSEQYATVKLAESGSTKTARATASVTSSVAGSVHVTGGGKRPSTRHVDADDARSWNSARDAIANRVTGSGSGDAATAVKRALDAWISADDQRAEPLALDGATVRWIAD